MKTRKKYAIGGSVKNYIETPEQALAKNGLNIDIAGAEANMNPLVNILKGLGNAGMQIALAKGGLGDSTGAQVGNALLPSLGNLEFALGGTVPVEVEGGEVLDMGDKTLDVKGKTHEEGGVKMSLPSGTEIYSDRIKIDNRSLSDRKKKREKKEVRLTDLLTSTRKGDAVTKSTMQRTQEINQKEDTQDREVQDMINLLVNPQPNEYATGGTVTAGDAVGIAGTLYSSLAPMFNTESNRAGDTPNINAFQNYGIEGLGKIDEAKKYLNTSKNQMLSDLELSQQAQTKTNRSNSRGVNTMRAFDLATYLGAERQKGKIESDFADKNMGILATEGGLLDQQDKMVMTGEQQRDVADRQDRDNYFTQKGLDISTLGEGIQETGKDMNAMQQNKVISQLLNELGMRFDVDPLTGEISAKKGAEEDLGVGKSFTPKEPKEVKIKKSPTGTTINDIAKDALTPAADKKSADKEIFTRKALRENREVIKKLYQDMIGGGSKVEEVIETGKSKRSRKRAEKAESKAKEAKTKEIFSKDALKANEAIIKKLYEDMMNGFNLEFK